VPKNEVLDVHLRSLEENENREFERNLKKERMACRQVQKLENMRE